MAFYPRSIEIEGILYKQISPNQWQVVNTGEIIDSTKMVLIINEFKKKKVAPITPTEGPTGACCTIPNQANGQFVCQNIREEGCGGGCFTIGGDCNQTEEQQPFCEVNCIRCCFLGDNYCFARKPANCVAAGGTYFGTNGCTACKYGVCSSDQNNSTTNATERFYGSRGCTGTFIVGGGISDFRTGVFCTGSGVGQTCFGPGMQYQALTPHFIQGGTCADCILGACCTGGTCAGITSQSACSLLNGIFFAGQTCGLCDFGVYCEGATTNRTCIRTGYRGENLSNQFQVGATCNYCITGTCCVNGTVSFGDSVRQSTCNGNFFANRFAPDACDKGSCCVGGSCTENVFRYDCTQTFNNGMTCIACTDGACCLSSGGCTLTSYASCFAQGGTFYGGATCSACDTGSCCNRGNCSNRRRGDGCTGTFYIGANCVDDPCRIGACCTGATCLGFNITRAECNIFSGSFHSGLTCIACATGANCRFPDNFSGFEDYTCNLVNYGKFLEVDPQGYFGFGRTCSDCDIGSCCASIQIENGSSIQIRGTCNTTSGMFSFFKGETLSICARGVFCTGSNEGQTCFGLGYRGQSLTNNFIEGATCSSCILGACCTGGTCLGGGLTSQAACNSAGGLFFAGRTCTSCDYGIFCTGATCLSFGYRGQSLSNNFIIGATCSSCILGACCTGGTCSGGGQTSQAACNGLFYPGATCRACDYGVYCTGATCFELGYRAQNLTNNFIQGATCNSCILGACCTGGTCLGGGQTSQAACDIAGGTFYVGATCTQCVTGVFCTGSGIGQTCFGLGHRGQSLTNNFIAGATCSSCILGACCTGGTCLGGGLTSQAACSVANGLFYAGTTCISCDYGVFCTGSDENKNCFQPQAYRAQNLTNEFISGGRCNDCNFGACCQGATCLGITSEASCAAVDGSFVDGATCSSCSSGITGICCTGAGSIQTVEDCAILGGHWFASGTTALCITGGCCTGGTCIEEIVGKSGNCQLFIAGSTCSICDTGVFCTGATCLQLGFRGQSLTSNFILGATCNSCILGICCTGGTCIGGGQTAQINCPASVGTFVAGATQCTACQAKVNCCLGGTCSYILEEECSSQGGIAFAGAQDCDLCDTVTFCQGNTCAGITLRGFNLTDNFIEEQNCDYCITGVCCDEENIGTLSNKALCLNTFYAGETDVNRCTSGLTFGLCCRATTNTCSEGVEQAQCDGYFVPQQTASQYSIYCSSNPCEYGVCCKENEVTSITGGVCLGVMRRAECSITGGEFFASSQGATCSNCIYTPMLGSVLLSNIQDDSDNNFKSAIRTGNLSGRTGNEIQPRLEAAPSGKPNTWVNWNASPRSYNPTSSVGATGPIPIIKETSYLYFTYLNLRYTSDTPFRAWYGATLTTGSVYSTTAVGNWQSGTGSFDYSPIFSSGFTRENGGSFGYVDPNIFESPRYARLVFGYGNPNDPYHNRTITARFSHNAGGARVYSRSDAARHAMLDPNQYNLYITDPGVPFSNANGTNNYSSPVLVQMFAENPLTRRVRPMGSCCKGTTCIGIVTQDHCAFTGGTFHANQTCNRCYPDIILGNCCVGGTHAGFTTLANCNKLSGVFFEGASFNSQTCNVGVICNANRTCYQGISYSYYGDFSSAEGRFFVQGDYRNTIGCNACDAGICCTGGTCMGVMPRTLCEALGGDTTYLNTCGTDFNNCETGVCCPFEVGCGEYTTRGKCIGDDKIFIAGASSGATCSACNSLMRLTQSTPGVTYTFIFNKGTTYGRFHDGSLWLQETDNLRIHRIKINYVRLALDAPGITLYSNTVKENTIVHPSGYRGTIYVHGAAKNLQPFFYVDKYLGVIRNDIQEPFTSLSFVDYNGGWKGPRTSGATEIYTNYGQFDLLQFLEMKKQLIGNGVTLGAGDVFLVNTTNFDPDKVETEWELNERGYPYQIFSRRPNTLTYGIFNCVSATAAAFINSVGSTLCFRPPTTWPNEDRANKPIYTLTSMEGKIPGQSGNPLVVLDDRSQNTNFTKAYAYPLSENIAQSYSQVSEFGDGSNYGTTTPIWSMFGARTNNSSYGDQYMGGLINLLQMAYATGPAKGVTLDDGTRIIADPKVSIDIRKGMIARVVQYGIDSWGAQRAFTVLGAGAGQKTVRTRPWVSIAGYFIGDSALYDPEATMLADTDRMEKWKAYLFTDRVTCSPKGDCLTEAQWRAFRIGGTGAENNSKGIRRQLAQWNENAALTTYEYVNNPANPVLHHEYVGISNRLSFQNHSTTGLTGITFYNSIGVTRPCSDKVSVYGDFGVIRWGTGSALATSHPDIRNPFLTWPYFNYTDQKGGEKSVLTHCWLRVLEGPGSSGGQGSRYYRIIDTNPGGFIRSSSDKTDSAPCNASLGGGYQLVIGQTWADGIPDHTSKIQLYPFIEEDFGITRPCLYCPSGFTSGSIPGFITVGNPREACGTPIQTLTDCSLWEASAGVSPYYGTAVDGFFNTFYYLKHITQTKGITLLSDAFPITDYIDMRFYTSPYNLYTWDQVNGLSNNSVLASWIPPVNDSTEVVSRINFAKYFPGIRRYKLGDQAPITIW